MEKNIKKIVNIIAAAIEKNTWSSQLSSWNNGETIYIGNWEVTQFSDKWTVYKENKRVASYFFEGQRSKGENLYFYNTDEWFYIPFKKFFKNINF